MDDLAQHSFTGIDSNRPSPPDTAQFALEPQLSIVFLASGAYALSSWHAGNPPCNAG